MFSNLKLNVTNIMIDLRIIYMLLALTTISSCTQREKTAKQDGTEVNSQTTPTEESVARTVTYLNNAMVNLDSLALDKLTSELLTYGHSSGLVQNKQEFIRDVLHGPVRFFMIDSPDQQIQVHGEIAIVRHLFVAKAKGENKPMNIRIGNVQVFQKDNNGGWQLLTRQAYKL
ncbi:MAG: nuclear transport factor 2 family protein [Flagellimonas sp.]